MMITEKAYAKLNISLDVTGKRPDGYHEMLTVMQTVSLCDEVTVELCDAAQSTAESNLHFIPNDERNLAVKAANAFFAAADMPGAAARITLNKVIPVCAGMGGGSSDAAAVLRALNKLTGFPLDGDALRRAASQVGSDVAFCVSGGTCLGAGRGDELVRLAPMPDCGFVICKPEFSISTPELFRGLDAVKLRCHPDTRGVCAAIGAGDLLGVAHRMYNIFEDVPDRRMSSIARIKGDILDTGALGAVMTGTGSAVFGIFNDFCSAEKAAERLSAKYKCFAAQTVGELRQEEL